MSVRLLILTEIISPYRIPVFNALARDPEIELHVVFLAETDPTEREWRVYKDEIQFSYEVLPSVRRRLAGKNFLLNRGLSRAASHANPDVVICGGYNYLASWQLMRWTRTRRIPILLWMESTAKDSRQGSWITESAKRWFMRHCYGVVVPGTASSRYANSFGIRNEKIFVASNAVDTELFAQQARIARENADALRRQFSLPARFFVFVGRLVAEKGVFDLLDAYARLALPIRRKVGLVFVGDGVARKDLEARAAAITTGSVFFSGFLQRNELGSIYALADALVLPTHSDTWGLVVNEAMACALPIIVTDVAGCTEDLVIDGKNGRVITAKHVDRLVAAMEDVASNEELRVSMGRCSQEAIRAYSPDCCAASIAAAALATVGTTARIDK